MTEQAAMRISIQGIVQGVGFRPFVYNLASRCSLTGWVKNTSSGVVIEVEGSQDALEIFLSNLKNQAPPLAQIDSLSREKISSGKYQDFQIRHSQSVPGGFQPISPDVSICDPCLQELFTPEDRRYRYPFINCTNCGPRFTIIKDIPYDRPETTMADLPMCDPCAGEYQDPLDRRFHAQPVACPECGPQIWLEMKTPGTPNGFEHAASRDQAVKQVQSLLAEGKIVAVKGLGGFHLACDAADQAAVERLRSRKFRPHKPLAVMMPDVETVRTYCRLSEAEEKLLSSIQRPILLLEKRAESFLPDGLAPGQNTLGVMLPYTPLHYLLFSREDRLPEAPYQVLVMTSGNYSDHPILINNQSLKEKLADVIDAALLHDRDIHVPCDDSVTRIPAPEQKTLSRPYPLRRSRGYTPYPVRLQTQSPVILGTGAEQKNTFCLSKDSYAFLSQHIGDLKNYETLSVYEKSILHFEQLFRAAPELLVHDLHPDYLATRYAQQRCESDGIPSLGIQHHHAHITSCLADNRHPAGEPVIGVAFDGTGYGTDGQIWGGEFMIADYRSFQRAYHLRYVPLPGGDLAVKEPWRMALSYLHSLDIGWDAAYPSVKHALTARKNPLGLRAIDVLRKQLKSGINSPLTSSVGRLFDAVSSLLGIRQLTSYEGQAAVELEALADPEESAGYPFQITRSGEIDPSSALEKIVDELRQGTPLPRISARFHNGLAAVVRDAARLIRRDHGLKRVALSGGVWQNITLLKKTSRLLEQDGFQIYIHHQVPANDGGIALGQVAAGQYLIGD